MMYKPKTFSSDFVWGTATASYQVEGATLEDGRGTTIWDTFCRVPGKVIENQNADVTCDQYHRYQEDVDLMGRINLSAYRFSLCWGRIIPTGSGAVNHKGIDYYKRLVEALLKAGVKPFVTLYHWDLPQPLQDNGGWANRETAYRFGEYAEVVFKELGGLIKDWITLNEPWCAAFLGYRVGYHAPGVADITQYQQVIHHLNMGHGLAVQACRAHTDGQIGTALNFGVFRPATARDEDKQVAELMNDDSKMYLYPLLGKEYPARYVERLESDGAPLPLQDGDYDIINQPIDFVGLNNYFELVVGKDIMDQLGGNALESLFNLEPRWEPTTEMGWHMTPDGFYHHIMYLQREIGDIPLYITENGIACPDVPTHEKRVEDYGRIRYLHSHLRQVLRAIDDGAQVKGYFLWSLIDNFEWAYGYTKRFGIIYCDYHTLERIPKNSYYYYRDVIAGYVDFNEPFIV